MMAGDLPPSSSVTFLRLPVAALAMSLPTSVEPVKATLSTRSWAARGAPQGSPKPVRMLTTPGGKPASTKSCAEAEAGERGLLGELEDDGAAGGERGAELPGGHQQREVPGDDLRDDADGLARGVGEEVMAGGERDGRSPWSWWPSRPCSGRGRRRGGHRRRGRRRRACRCRGLRARRTHRCAAQAGQRDAR